MTQRYGLDPVDFIYIYNTGKKVLTECALQILLDRVDWKRGILFQEVDFKLFPIL